MRDEGRDNIVGEGVGVGVGCGVGKGCEVMCYDLRKQGMLLIRGMLCVMCGVMREGFGLWN